MQKSIGRLIVKSRQALRLTQHALARRLGTSASEVSRWESGQRDVPAEWFGRLAVALGVDLKLVIELATPFPLIRPAESRRIYLPSYPIKGSLLDLPEWFRARFSLAPVVRDELEYGFPRDTSYELAVAVQLLAAGGQLCFGAPLDLDCTLLVVEPRTERCAGHMLRHAVRLVHESRELLAFPQVSTIVVSQSKEARLDYLLIWRGRGVRIQVDLEVDGGYHMATANQDARRTYGLGLRRLTFENSQVLSIDFVSRLIAKLRKLELEQRAA